MDNFLITISCEPGEVHFYFNESNPFEGTYELKCWGGSKAYWKIDENGFYWKHDKLYNWNNGIGSETEDHLMNDTNKALVLKAIHELFEKPFFGE